MNAANDLRVLVFSTLYPNAIDPAHGVFVETRLRHLLADGGIEARVVAPVPWFPLRHARFGAYARMAAVAPREQRNGIRVEHPRFIRLPKVGMTSAPFTLARSGLAAARRLIAEGFEFDLIDAHYLYPDGVAAVMIGQALGKPVVMTARGSDVNLIPQHRLPRRMILDAAAKSAAMITVCAALKDELIALGAPGNKITVLRNGVDLELFSPGDRAAARRTLGIGTGFVIASVGHLIPRKGHHLVIEALRHLPDASLQIAGVGPELERLRTLATQHGVADRVIFLGALAQPLLRELYRAADCLALASSREGWANVLLEAMACGTPVVASDVWGTPEVVAAPEAGELMSDRSARGVADAVEALRRRAPPRGATRRYAEGFDWAETSAGQRMVFERALASHGAFQQAA